MNAKVYSKINYDGSARLLTESLVCDNDGVFVLAQFKRGSHMSVVVYDKNK